MTTTPHGQVPEALEDFEVRKLAAIGAVSTSSGLVERRPIEYRRELENQFVRGFRAAEKRFAALRTQQPAPATQQAGDVVAYLDVGAGGYLDLGSELSEDALQQLPKGRHALVIAGTYGIDGYVAAPQPSPTAQPAPQQEAQEPVAWYVTGCGRLLDEDEAKAEARHIGGTARAIPLYTVPQADSQPAPVLDALPREDFAWLVVQEACETEPADEDDPECIRILRRDLKSAVLAAFLRQDASRAPADSVTAPAGGVNWQDISTAPKDGTRFVAVGQNYGLDSEMQHVCIAQWFRGCWIEVSDWNGASKLKYLTHWMPLPPLPGSAASATANSVTAPAFGCQGLRLLSCGIGSASKEASND